MQGLKTAEQDERFGTKCDTKKKTMKFYKQFADEMCT
jgi:hypothetical protein